MNKEKRWTVAPLQRWLLAVLKRILGVRHHAFMVCHARVWIGTPTHSSIGLARAAMWPYNSLTKPNSYTMNKVLHADMQLSTRSNDCWSALHCHGWSDTIVYLQTKAAKL